LRISSQFDGGAIEFAGESSAAAGVIELDIRKDSTADPSCDFRQWFYYRLEGARGRSVQMRLRNASHCTYPHGWSGYHAVASYDRTEWFRVPTHYDGQALVIDHTVERDVAYYAYFEPYPWERHLSLLGRVEASGAARLEDLATTPDGREVTLVSAGSGGRPVWVIARQHPGETMAEWFVEGMLERLLDPSDPVGRSLLSLATFHVVPNMNPDGSVRGNLRSNAAGANLNREWMTPTRERSPEVFAVRERMRQAGVEVFLDVHGDEGLPYVFVAGSEMLPGFTPLQARLQPLFCDRLKEASPDFQTEHGYPSAKYNEDALKLASKWVGHTFGCLSLTLEMPFKDNANLPDPRLGWNGQRSKRLGQAVLPAMLAVLRAAG
jgi:murein tripeptide amidase MpaA